MGGKFSHLENKGFIAPFNINLKGNVTYWIGFATIDDGSNRIRGIRINNEFDKEEEDTFNFSVFTPAIFLIFGNKKQVNLGDTGRFIML